MTEKFIIIQHNNLSEADIEELNNLAQYMFARTGIGAIIVPKNVETIGKQDIEQFIEKLKIVLSGDKPLNQEYIDQIPKE